MPENINPWRKTTQYLMPPTRTETSVDAYEIYPAHNIGNGKISTGYTALEELLRGSPIIIVDGIPGVLWDKFHENFSDVLQKYGVRANFVDVQQAMLSPEKIDGLIAPFMGGDDPLFGFRYPGNSVIFLTRIFSKRFNLILNYQVNVVYGCGAALANWQGALVYLDVPKNEIQFRARAFSIKNLGAADALPPGIAYKRSYFIDWVVANQHEASLLSKIDWMVDEQRPDSPTIISVADLRRGLEQLSRSFFRVRPWFEPGPWGGQWILEKIPHLPQDVPNYAWSFELIAPENGLFFELDGNMLEVSFDTLMFQEYLAVLGELAERFRYEFPIRYDFLDTVDGGNLSVQVHPRPQYIRENFGETFTQDECYYILDCVPGRSVNLGFQQGIAAREFREALETSAEQVTPVEMEKYIQSLSVKKHDLFLDPKRNYQWFGRRDDGAGDFGDALYFHIQDVRLAAPRAGRKTAHVEHRARICQPVF